MERLRSYNEGPLSDAGLVQIFNTIIAESRRLMAQARYGQEDSDAAPAAGPA